MTERLPSQKRVLRMHGRFGYGGKEQLQSERRHLKTAAEAFAHFPDGFTPADEATLGPVEHSFAGSFHNTLTAMAPFLPPAVRFMSYGQDARYYTSATQEILRVNSNDFGIRGYENTAKNIFPEFLGEYDIDFLRSSGRGRTEPIDVYTTTGMYNHTPYSFDHRIGFVTNTLAPFLDQDVYGNPVYISGIGNMRRDVQTYKETVDTITADNAGTLQSATGDLISKLVKAEGISQEDLPTVEFSLPNLISFNLDLQTLQLTRFKRKVSKEGTFSVDETVPAREAKPMEWCILAPYIKDNILHRLHMDEQVPYEHLPYFKTNFDLVTQTYYLLLPNLWRE